MNMVESLMSKNNCKSDSKREKKELSKHEF
jgi:hypothetical protein